MKNKSIMLKANEKLLEMIEKIKEVRVMDTSTSVIRFCIVETYNQYFKSYGKDKLNASAMVVREPAKTKVEKKEQEMMDLCTQLGGILQVNGDKKMCHYTIYEVLNPNCVQEFPSTVPLSLITPDIIARQYYPSKESVQEILSKKLL